MADRPNVRCVSVRGRLMSAACAALPMLMAAAPTARAGDIEFGRYLGTECLTCHRDTSDARVIPNIFGLGEAHIVEALKSYRAGKLANPVMQTVASRLKDEEIEALAAFFTTAKRP